MKIFDATEPWPTKVNFVDENNVILGYDMTEQCCETFGWFITDKVILKTNPIPDDKGDDFNMKEWVFDPEYFNEISFDQGIENTCAIAIFRIVNSNRTNQKFICLYNCHNGYYTHGFTFSVVNKEGKL